MAALRLLQMEYPKEDQFRDRYEHLSTLLMTTDQTLRSLPNNNTSSNGGEVAQKMMILKEEINDGGHMRSHENVLNVLYKVLPPSLMLPPDRLKELLRQCELFLLSYKKTLISMEFH